MTTKPERSRDGIESHELTAKGHRVHYLKAGSGPPIVLVHGGASDSRDWINTMEALSHRYTLYAPDLIGYGQSERNESGYYQSDFIDFIEEFIDKLDLKNPALIGHSFGGRICVGIAARLPERISKLVLVDSAGFGRVSRFGSSIMTVIWAVRKVLGHPQPYPRFLTKEGEDTDWLCLHELPALKTPTLLIWKKHDPYLLLSLAVKAEKAIPGSRLEVLNGIGHAPHKKGNGDFIKPLIGFLEES